jgi:membrane protease YdiL (CAAX protease family)
MVLALPQAVIAGCTINALFAFGEEIGWRGWLERELQTLGFWRANLIVGILWGMWHAPIILVGHNYPNHPVQGVFLFVVICIGLAPLHSQARRSAKSVWAAAMMHGTLNASAGVSALVVAGSDLMVGVAGLAGLLALAVANGLLWLARRHGVVAMA